MSEALGYVRTPNEALRTGALPAVRALKKCGACDYTRTAGRAMGSER